MLMPFMRAASKTLVPAGTRAGCPSRGMSTSPGGGVAVVILRANDYALGFARARRRRGTNTAGALALEDVRVDFGAEVFQNGLNRRGHDLAEAADRSETHGLGQF